MDKVTGRLFVFFEEPFWVGIFECEFDGKLSASKVTFGAEPKDYEIQDFILKNYRFLKFSQAIDAKEKKIAANPKRRQRDAGKWIQKSGIGTKSQLALKLQQEEQKTKRKIRNKIEQEEKEQRMFDLKQQKRKEKHRGR